MNWLLLRPIFDWRLRNWVVLLTLAILVSLPVAGGARLIPAEASSVFDERLVQVSATNSNWTDTGISVQGEPITIEYVSGRWRTWSGEDWDGTGCTYCPIPDRRHISCTPYREIRHGALIGRIGNGTPFYVGNSATIRGEVGRVSLRINDTCLSDNFGALTVRVRTSGSSAIPNPPSNLRVIGASPNSISLTWQDNSNNEDGFVVYRWNGSIYAIIGNTEPNNTNFTDRGLQCNTGYSYEVSAQNSAGKSSRVRTEGRTAPCATQAIPQPPQAVRIAGVTQNSVTVTWLDNSNNERGFHIYRWRGGSWDRVGSVGANATSFTENNLECDTTNSYQVSAYNDAGESQRVQAEDVRTSNCGAPPSIQLQVTNVQLEPNPSTKFELTKIQLRIENRGGQSLPHDWTYTGLIKIVDVSSNIQQDVLQERRFAPGQDSSLVLDTEAVSQGNYQVWNLTINAYFWKAVQVGRLDITVQPSGGLPALSVSQPIFIKSSDNPTLRCAVGLVDGFTIAFPGKAEILLEAMVNVGKLKLCESQGIGCYTRILLEQFKDVQYAQIIKRLLSMEEAYQEFKSQCQQPFRWVTELVKEAIRTGEPIGVSAVYSPASIMVVTSSGQRAGVNEAGAILQEIPDSVVLLIGDQKLVFYPADGPVTTILHGTGTGTMTVELANGGAATEPKTAVYQGVIVRPGERFEVSSTDVNATLRIDTNGDGKTDQTRAPDTLELLSAPKSPPPSGGILPSIPAYGTVAHPAFGRVWARTDSLVAAGAVSRTWFWGPAAGAAAQEQYTDAPGGTGTRVVQYFDKSRMEINDPNGDQNTPFFVTNGLLAVELIGGVMQTGDTTFVERYSANIPIAGDTDDTQAPTYASFASVSNTGKGDRPQSDMQGQAATATINKAGQVGDDPSKAGVPGVRIAHYETATRHNIPEVFWQFLNASGPVNDRGQAVNSQLITPWFFASGYPISEAYWARVKIAGEVRDVMIQAFERRVLTYVPSNPAGWQVEMGNIGTHYYEWRYKDAGKEPGTGFGPASGELLHTKDPYPNYVADVQLLNLEMECRFYNPYDASQNPWDYFVTFRTHNKGSFVFAVISTRQWILLQDGVVAQGTLTNLDTSAGGSNVLKVVAKDSGGELFVNGQRIATVDLSSNMLPGHAAIGSGLYIGNKVPGEVTRYEGFRITPLP